MDDPYAVVKHREAAFNAGDADAVTALYAPSATLWGTLAQEVTASTPDIRSYFQQATRSGLKIRLGAQVLQPISRNVAVDCGHCEFSRAVDGQTMFFRPDTVSS